MSSRYNYDCLAETGKILDVISVRQQAIGDNLANIDTPGYVRKDVDFGKYIDSMHTPCETDLAKRLGKSVIMEQQQVQEITPATALMELQKHAILYTMAPRRMSNIITEMKTAVSVGK